MEVKQVLHMNGGFGDTSYASNSLLQRKVISMTKPIIEEAITELYISMNAPNNLCMAELGCSSGPNTMVVATEIVKIVRKLCLEIGRQPPEFQIHLNDLTGNDFNSIFRDNLPMFQLELRDEKSRGQFSPCFVSAVPGSFYGRLFAANTVHFIHSSYSLQWISKIPKEVELLNKDNIYMSSASPTQVIDTYYNQFRIDFYTFLRCRSEEIVSGGRMVLTILGRRGHEDACREGCCYIWELLALVLKQMVAEGLIEKEKLRSFNIPNYTPSPREVKEEVEKEGSFGINHLETSEISLVDWSKGFRSADEPDWHNVSRGMRAVSEPLLSEHFGGFVMDQIFEKYSEILRECSNKGPETKFVNVTVSVTRNGK
ncbi:S-adenosyl-L-methionine:benzoic acid/salicylic acid carboxyl methyltransferase 2-like [Primulina tabacum]|uniref:S-adenosyl-L-methionine:benzoic acid/salicylic acid carboxyl methyltransferase 2-like n=1 Tax=Primulina tabacum TaxID=48773 RepID=UPI003F5934AD